VTTATLPCAETIAAATRAERMILENMLVVAWWMLELVGWEVRRIE
jgi:hypothetical protein